MTNKQIVGKFLGPHKIEDVFGDDKKTFLGGEYVNVLLDNGKTEFLPLKVVEIVSTDEKSDLTTRQDKLFVAVIPQLIGIMADYDLTLFDTTGLINRLSMSIGDNVKQAVAKKFNKDDQDKITLMQVNDVLKEEK